MYFEARVGELALKGVRLLLLSGGLVRHRDLLDQGSTSDLGIELKHKQSEKYNYNKEK